MRHKSVSGSLLLAHVIHVEGGERHGEDDELLLGHRVRLDVCSHHAHLGAGQAVKQTLVLAMDLTEN